MRSRISTSPPLRGSHLCRRCCTASHGEMDSIPTPAFFSFPTRRRNAVVREGKKEAALSIMLNRGIMLPRTLDQSEIEASGERVFLCGKDALPQGCARTYENLAVFFTAAAVESSEVDKLFTTSCWRQGRWGCRSHRHSHPHRHHPCRSHHRERRSRHHRRNRRHPCPCPCRQRIRGADRRP